MKTTGYIIALLAITLLASCGAKEIVTPEITSKLPEVSVPEEILEEVLPIIETLTEEGWNSMDAKIKILDQTYTTPAGEHDISFTLETNGGIIQSVSVNSQEIKNPITLKMIGLFDEASSELEGLSIQKAKDIGVIGGASLTTGAFQKALTSL